MQVISQALKIDDRNDVKYLSDTVNAFKVAANIQKFGVFKNLFWTDTNTHSGLQIPIISLTKQTTRHLLRSLNSDVIVESWQAEMVPKQMVMP